MKLFYLFTFDISVSLIFCLVSSYQIFLLRFFSSHDLSQIILLKWFLSNDLLISLRWWYESSQYTDDVVYCWMNTRFWLLSSKWSICRSVNHVTLHYLYLIRLSSIYLIDKIFRSHTDITRKWWNRLFVLNNLFILSCSLIHSFHSCCRSQIDDICVNQLRKSLTRINLRHCIDRICIFINFIESS
jgi:hypothetical protein